MTQRDLRRDRTRHASTRTRREAPIHRLLPALGTQDWINGARFCAPTTYAQKFIAVTSEQLSGPHGKVMQMPERARVEESEAESYPIIVRSFEPVADLDDRLQRIFTVRSFPVRAGNTVSLLAVEVDG